MNHGIDSYSPMALILAGQPEFLSVVRTLPMVALRRRVDTFYHLGGMTAQETKQYISYQMTMAGASHPIFPDDVAGRVHEHPKGIAANINTLCKGCLLDAASRTQQLVDLGNLGRAIADFS